MSTKPSYLVRGVVERVVPAQGAILLRHEAIQGLMPAMTMTYKVVDPAALGEMHRGDQITATLLGRQGPNGFEDARLADIDIVGEAKPDEDPPSGQFHLPAPGERLPDFVLLDQSGKMLHLSSLRGKAVALTFIYTRCPLADYCPRMSRNFAEIDQALATEPSLYQKTHLVSVSFDPQHDTPSVLRSYGEAYTGRYTKETFAHWSFAAPPPAELSAVQHWFGLGITPGPGGSLQHSLSTVMVGTDGRVLAFYPDNNWTVAEAMRVLQTAVREASTRKEK